MISGISSYGWNPLLSPSYSNWASVANSATTMDSSGMSPQLQSEISAAETNGELFQNSSASNGNSSLLAGLNEEVALNPNDFNTAYQTGQVITNMLGGNNMSTQDFLAQTQKYANPLFQVNNGTSGTNGISSSDMSSLLSQSENSAMESFAPNYYLSTFNPYSYLMPDSTGNSSILSLLA
ncbi:hypothetical protein [Alicyclobacillus dauci]|uniref:Uncharacterized protein n=1 Tax=Alicyclobacillus dauci TaxID=1475485 RepID=A0ABY6Z9K8_9BACL|nr:hypothetical protein [Alicyclobacillus dauci]WAH39526.1 hypothetical protein NZD86_24475 [Alicyclobacillus dauci]WAH39586.1 hypothetical protein NZD86_24175 [Alicyclobacillus dauci]